MGNLSTDSVWAAEKARCDGLMAGVRAPLEKLYTSDYAYIHSTGRREERESYLATATSGANKFLGFEHQDVKVDIIGTVALMSGTVLMKREKADNLFLFVEVWVHDGQQWQLKFQQNTKKA
jgi:hypothetical protein